MNVFKKRLLFIALIPYMAGAGYVQMADYLQHKDDVVVEAPSFSDSGMIGEVRMFAGNFAPRNWALCQGQLLAISTNQALFSVLGTTYGGDGRTTFALPDLRGRAPIGTGTGPGLSNARLGQKTGTESLMTLRIPAAGGGSGGERELARGKSTRQSSDYRPGQGVSRLAVDGNTSGVWGNRSVTHTTGSASDMNPYWEVDLGASYKISRIEVYNRTDCCKERLNNFKILVDGREFVPGLQRYKAGQANPMTYRGNKTGRKVKIQISGRGIVSLAEVKVYGTPLSGGSTSGGTTKQVAGTTKQPSLGMNYIICLQGVYPSRN